jgi:hypothetical protein
MQRFLKIFYAHQFAAYSFLSLLSLPMFFLSVNWIHPLQLSKFTYLLLQFVVLEPFHYNFSAF